MQLALLTQQAQFIQELAEDGVIEEAEEEKLLHRVGFMSFLPSPPSVVYSTLSRLCDARRCSASGRLSSAQAL